MSLAIKVFVFLLAWTIVSIVVGSLFGRLLKILGGSSGEHRPDARRSKVSAFRLDGDDGNRSSALRRRPRKEAGEA
jgi:hypothetical protein